MLEYFIFLRLRAVSFFHRQPLAGMACGLFLALSMLCFPFCAEAANSEQAPPKEASQSTAKAAAPDGSTSPELSEQVPDTEASASEPVFGMADVEAKPALWPNPSSKIRTARFRRFCSTSAMISGEKSASNRTLPCGGMKTLCSRPNFSIPACFTTDWFPSTSYQNGKAEKAHLFSRYVRIWGQGSGR